VAQELEVVDVSLILNGIRSWWCARVFGTKLEKGKRRYRVKPLAKMFSPRWVGDKQVRPCSHTPQVASPHDSVVAEVVSNLEVRSCGRVHGHLQNRYVGLQHQPGSESLAHSKLVTNSSTLDPVVVLTINGVQFQVKPCS
jgi:hypothetical protein